MRRVLHEMNRTDLRMAAIIHPCRARTDIRARVDDASIQDLIETGCPRGGGAGTSAFPLSSPAAVPKRVKHTMDFAAGTIAFREGRQ